METKHTPGTLLDILDENERLRAVNVELWEALAVMVRACDDFGYLQDDETIFSARAALARAEKETP